MRIKPEPDECPWCGFTEQWVWEPGPDMRSIACSNGLCAATGPVRATVALAVEAWNQAPRGTHD